MMLGNIDDGFRELARFFGVILINNEVKHTGTHRCLLLGGARFRSLFPEIAQRLLDYAHIKGFHRAACERFYLTCIAARTHNSSIVCWQATTLQLPGEIAATSDTKCL